MKAIVIDKERMKNLLFEFEYKEISEAEFPFTAYSDGTTYDAEGHMIWDEAPKGWLAELVEEEGEEV